MIVRWRSSNAHSTYYANRGKVEILKFGILVIGLNPAIPSGVSFLLNALPHMNKQQNLGPKAKERRSALSPPLP